MHVQVDGAVPAVMAKVRASTNFGGLGRGSRTTWEWCPVAQATAQDIASCTRL